jgi:diguanylate cyclase (GGDEF)-like protein
VYNMWTHRWSGDRRAKEVRMVDPGRGVKVHGTAAIVGALAPVPTRGAALRAALQAVPRPVRVWAFSMTLSAIAIVMFLAFLHGRQPNVALIQVPWYVMAVGFFAAELKVVDVHFRREKHSFSLSEFPAVIGYFVLTPDQYFLALLTGAGAALIYQRHQPIKMAFNLSNWAMTSATALTVFYALQVADTTPDPRDWLAAFAATFIAAVLSACSVSTAISLSGGAPQFEKLPEMIQFGTLVAVANTSLALLAVCVATLDPALLWLLVVPLVTVFLAYRAYVSEREKHERLELLYQSSRILQHSPELDSALAALLEHAREMFRAERAEVLLWPKEGENEGLLTTCVQDDATTAMVPIAMADANELHRRVGNVRKVFMHIAPPRDGNQIRHAMVAPLLGESGMIGSLVIANRLTEGTTFGDDDLRLLETLANQAAVALENGQLEQSLSELSRLKEQLRYQAYHDPLTGLANRSLFAEEVDLALAHPTEGRLPVVLFLDLDNFKDVNDTLGHAAGDRLLTAVAERVRACTRGNDLAARLGGDEFAILLEDDHGLGSALTVATRLIDAMTVTFPVLGQDLKISASVGIAASQGRGELANDLLRNADVAMYTAKQGGKNRFAVFEPTMHAAIVARHALSRELAHGIGEGEIDVFYQPILSLASGRPTGVEALARWRHPTRGIVAPDDFIPLAEESGSILELGRAVLFEACREAAPWRNDLGDPLTLTVNLSAAQLQQDTFVSSLLDILRATGFEAERLVLEMTETVMFHDTQTTIARLAALRELGVRIAVDDFGTGYSSIGYLRRFRVDVLKIAREFVASADAGPDGWAFAHAIVALGRTLNLRIIAEGIEEPAQLEELRDMGCEFGQGFLFARPVPGESVAGLLLAPTAARAAEVYRSGSVRPQVA